jgi:hypothetical protein
MVFEKPKIAILKFKELRFEILGCPLVAFMDLGSVGSQDIFFIIKKFTAGVSKFISKRLSKILKVQKGLATFQPTRFFSGGF